MRQSIAAPLEHITSRIGNGAVLCRISWRHIFINRRHIVQGRLRRLRLRTENLYLVAIDPVYLVRVSVVIYGLGPLAAEPELDSLPVYVLVAVDVLVNAGGHNTRTQRKCQIKYCISSHIVDLIYGVSEIPCPAPLRND